MWLSLWHLLRERGLSPEKSLLGGFNFLVFVCVLEMKQVGYSPFGLSNLPDTPGLHVIDPSSIKRFSRLSTRPLGQLALSRNYRPNPNPDPVHEFS